MKSITLSEFILLAFKTYIVESDNPESVRFSYDYKEIHSKFDELFAKYRTKLTVLTQASFERDGAFPYSMELSTALDSMLITGNMVREIPSEGKFKIRYHKDTKQVISKRLDETFEGDDNSREAFYNFVRDIEPLEASEAFV